MTPFVSSFGLLHWRQLSLYHCIISVQLLFGLPEEASFIRRRTLRKSVQMRPKRRKENRLGFSLWLSDDKPEEISAQLLKIEEESVTSQSRNMKNTKTTIWMKLA